MDDKSTDIWILNFVEGRSYAGKVVSCIGKDDVERDPTKGRVLDAKRIALNPCLDIFSPIRPVMGPPGEDGKPQRLSFSRDPVVMPFEFTTSHMPVHMRPGTIAFFDDMSKEDNAMYTKFVDNALAAQIAMRLEREKRIVLPNDEDQERLRVGGRLLRG